MSATESTGRGSLRSFVLAVALAAVGTAILLAARDTATAETVRQAPTSTMPSPTTPPASASASPDRLARGRELYLTSCVSCHAPNGVGTANGPSLLGSGEAKADFYLRTGRMPLAAPVPQPPSKPVAYSDEQIKQLVAYVGSLCDRTISECPPIPNINVANGSLSDGGALFLANCAPCHNSVAVGGALSFGRHAPSLQETPPRQVAEAVRTGPGQMPRFGTDVLSDEQVDSVVRYVEYLHEPDHPGGFSLGYIGPVAEGFVALLVGLAILILAIRWITREPDEEIVT